MTSESPHDLTLLLHDWNRGDHGALDKIIPRVYAELRRLAHIYMTREQPGHILQMTERWLSLWQQSALDLQDAVLAATTSSMAITGLVKEEMLFYRMKHPGNEMLAWLPNVRVMFNAEPDRDAQFELAVRSLIDGLHVRLTLYQNTSVQTHSVKPAGDASHHAQQQQRGNTPAHLRVGRKPGTRSKG